MKKTLTILTMVITTAFTTMIAQEHLYNDEQMKRFIIMFFCDGHAPPLKYDENGNFIPYKVATALDWANGNKIPHERMLKLIEEIIRERLPILRGVEDEKYDLLEEVIAAIELLKIFHGPNTLALLKECAQIKDSWISLSIAETYILIQEEEGDSISFLKELKETNNFPDKYAFCLFIEDIIADLKEKNKNEAVENYLAFLLDLILTEEDPCDANQIDRLLCKILDGYPQSVQREQMTQIFLNFDDDWTRERFNEIKSEIEKLPADKRIDFSKGVRLVEHYIEHKKEDAVTESNKINNLSPSAIVNTTDETEQSNYETPSKQAEKSSSKKILFGFSVVVILVFIGGVVAWRKK